MQQPLSPLQPHTDHGRKTLALLEFLLEGGRRPLSLRRGPEADGTPAASSPTGTCVAKLRARWLQESLATETAPQTLTGRWGTRPPRASALAASGSGHLAHRQRPTCPGRHVAEGLGLPRSPSLPLPPACGAGDLGVARLSEALPSSPRAWKGPSGLSWAGKGLSTRLPIRITWELVNLPGGFHPATRDSEPPEGLGLFSKLPQVISGPGNDEKDGGRARDGLQGREGAGGSPQRQGSGLPQSTWSS